MQLYIYSLQDEAAAKTKLKTAYDAEVKTIDELRDKFSNLGSTLRNFRETLIPDTGTGLDAYARAYGKFRQTSNAAMLGDADAMGRLQSVSQDFLNISKEQARSEIEYLRDLARVRSGLDASIGAADEAVDYQQAQLTALEQMVGQYIDLNSNVLSVRDAILDVEAARQHQIAIGANVGAIPVVTPINAPANAQNSAEVAALRSEIVALRSQMAELVNGMNRTATATEGTKAAIKGVTENQALRVREAD
jgi:hypothetical protein